MANNSLNVSIPLKFEIKTPPRGMTDYDPKALSADQQKELNAEKLNVRKENIAYLVEHPEQLKPEAFEEQNSHLQNICIVISNFFAKECVLLIDGMIKAVVSMIIRRVLVRQPRNVIEFLAKLFTRPEHQIREEVNKILREPLLEFDTIPYSDYEKWDY